MTAAAVLTAPVNGAGSGGGAAGPLVATLEAAWETIRRHHPEIAPAVIVVASGTSGGPARWGHFAASRWRHTVGGDDLAEILVAGEGLERGAAEVLGTLLHEAAHALAHVRDVKDTSRQGRYHNRRYRQVATELGLDVVEVGDIGWSGTTVPADTAARYADELEAIGAALVIHRRPEGSGWTRGGGAGTEGGGEEGGEGSDGGEGTTTALPKRSVACPCGRRIRVARAVLEAGAITCGLCGGDFAGRLAEEEG